MNCRTCSIALSVSELFHNTMFSNSIHVVANNRILSFFVGKYYFIAYVQYFLYLLVFWWNLGWFCMLAVVNSTIINMPVQMFFSYWFHFLSWVIWQFCILFLTHHTASCNGYTNLYSYQQCMRILLCFHPYQEKILFIDTHYVYICDI